MNTPLSNDVSEKASRILHMILFAFTLIGIRVWYLAVIKHEEHLRLSKRPQHQILIETPSRGTIRDRFNIPLAVNKIRYNAAVVYEPIRHLPRISWVTEEGKRKKIFFRKEYIEKISRHLAHELSLDPVFVEDLIYSKAALFPNTPFVLKENISEEEYYRLHIMEKDWPGMAMQISSVRHYPQNKVAAPILGYMGAIDETKHTTIRAELALLEQYLNERKMGLPVFLPKGYTSSKEVKRRYEELKNKSYTINSRVGKSGIEGLFDEDLRGICGRKKTEIDIKGNILRTLPESYEAVPGRRILLSISSELQAYAEELLEENELYRHERFIHAGVQNKEVFSPWIKGGAIVALIPSTGEIVTMASYPRYNPNDFVEPGHNKKVFRWLESESYIGAIWDGYTLLERDFDLAKPPIYLPKEQKLSWNLFLDMILSTSSSVKTALLRISTIGNGIYLQNTIETLMKLAGLENVQPLIDTLFPPSKGHELTFFSTSKEERMQILEKLKSKTTLLEELSAELGHFLSRTPKNDDKILAIDLCRLVCPSHLFDDSLLTTTGDESLSTYRSFNQAAVSMERKVRKIAREVFVANDFKDWRKQYFADYLASKRDEEKKQGRHQRPYLDYLNEIEEEFFEHFFHMHRWEFLKSYLLDNAPLDLKDPRLPYFHGLIAAGSVDKDSIALQLKNHLLSLPRENVVPYLKTMRSYRELGRPLLGKYYFPAGGGRTATEKDLAKHFYPAGGFGFSKSYAYQENAPFGSIFKLFTSYEALRQREEKKKSSGERLDLNPMVMVDQSPPYREVLKNNSILGYTQEGKPITRIYKGARVPRGHPNIGRIDLKGALERSSNIYFALLADEHLSDPNDLAECVKRFGFGKKTGIELTREAAGFVPNDTGIDTTALYSFAIGQHSLIVTPLQGAVALSAFVNDGKILKPHIIDTIANLEPSETKSQLFEKKEFTYQEALANIGIFFPLFTEVIDRTTLPYVYQPQKTVSHEIDLSRDVKAYLLDSLFAVVNGERGSARLNVIRNLLANPTSRQIYSNIRKSMCGKTSTAEIFYRPHLDREMPPILTKHVWFGAIGFEEEGNPLSSPDLVVLVYLRFGDYGKEAAPIAANILNKWREIKKRQS